MERSEFGEVDGADHPAAHRVDLDLHLCWRLHTCDGEDEARAGGEGVRVVQHVGDRRAVDHLEAHHIVLIAGTVEADVAGLHLQGVDAILGEHRPVLDVADVLRTIGGHELQHFQSAADEVDALDGPARRREEDLEVGRIVDVVEEQGGVLVVEGHLDLRSRAHDVVVQDVRAIEGDVQHRVLLVVEHFEAQLRDVVEVVLLQLIVEAGEGVERIGFDPQVVHADEPCVVHVDRVEQHPTRGQRCLAPIVDPVQRAVGIGHPGGEQQAVHVDGADVAHGYGHLAALSFVKSIDGLQEAAGRVDRTFRRRRGQQLPAFQLRGMRNEGRVVVEPATEREPGVLRRVDVQRCAGVGRERILGRRTIVQEELRLCGRDAGDLDPRAVLGIARGLIPVHGVPLIGGACLGPGHPPEVAQGLHPYAHVHIAVEADTDGIHGRGGEALADEEDVGHAIGCRSELRSAKGGHGVVHRVGGIVQRKGRAIQIAPCVYQQIMANGNIVGEHVRQRSHLCCVPFAEREELLRPRTAAVQAVVVDLPEVVVEILAIVWRFPSLERGGIDHRHMQRRVRLAAAVVLQIQFDPPLGEVRVHTRGAVVHLAADVVLAGEVVELAAGAIVLELVEVVPLELEEVRLSPALPIGDVLEGFLEPVVIAGAETDGVAAAAPEEHKAVQRGVEREDGRLPADHSARRGGGVLLHHRAVVGVGGVDLQHVVDRRREWIDGAGLQCGQFVGDDRELIRPCRHQIAGGDQQGLLRLVVRQVLDLIDRIGIQVHLHVHEVLAEPACAGRYRYGEHGGILEVHLQAGEERIEHGAILQGPRQAHHEGLGGALADVGDHGLHLERVEIGGHRQGCEQDVVVVDREVRLGEAVHDQRRVAVQGEGLDVVQVLDATAGVQVVVDAVLHVHADALPVVQLAETPVVLVRVGSEQARQADVHRCEEGDGALCFRQHELFAGAGGGGQMDVARVAGVADHQRVATTPIVVAHVVDVQVEAVAARMPEEGHQRHAVLDHHLHRVGTGHGDHVRVILHEVSDDPGEAGVLRDRFEAREVTAELVPLRFLRTTAEVQDGLHPLLRLGVAFVHLHLGEVGLHLRIRISGQAAHGDRHQVRVSIQPEGEGHVAGWVTEGGHTAELAAQHIGGCPVTLVAAIEARRLDALANDEERARACVPDIEQLRAPIADPERMPFDTTRILIVELFDVGHHTVVAVHGIGLAVVRVHQCAVHQRRVRYDQHR